MSDYFFHPVADAELDLLLNTDLFSQPRETLTARRLALVVVVNLLAQYLNGGLTQWVENGYAEDDAQDLLSALAEIESSAEVGPHTSVSAVRDIIGEVCHAVETDEPDDDDYRSGLSGWAYERLDALDRRLDAVQEEFRRQAGIYFAQVCPA